VIGLSARALSYCCPGALHLGAAVPGFLAPLRDTSLPSAQVRGAPFEAEEGRSLWRGIRPPSEGGAADCGRRLEIGFGGCVVVLPNLELAVSRWE